MLPPAHSCPKIPQLSRQSPSYPPHPRCPTGPIPAPGVLDGPGVCSASAFGVESDLEFSRPLGFACQRVDACESAKDTYVSEWRK
jgi:hypothetical protein